MAVKCSACGYANYNPDARACELCHAKLGGGGAATAAKADATDDLARLTEAALEEAAQAKEPAATAAPRPPAAPAGPGPAAVGVAAVRGAGGLDALLFALSLPLTLPAALWVLLRGRGDWQAVPVSVWLGQAMLILTGAAALTFMGGADAAAWTRAVFPAGLACALVGGLLLVRIGEPAAGWGVVGTLLGGACLAGGAVLATRAGPVFEGHTDLVRAVQVSADGRRLVTAGEDGTVRRWDVAGRALVQTARAHTPSATSVRLDPTGPLIASAGADGQVLVWDEGDLEAEPRARILAHRGGVTAIDYHGGERGGRLLTGGVDGMARVWSTVDQAELGALKLHRGAVTAVAWSPDGQRAASGGVDGAVFVWQAPEGRALVFERHEGPVLCLAWSPDGQRLASGGEDGLVCLWETARPREAPVTLTGGGAVRALALLGGGKRLLSAHDDRSLALWDLEGGAALGRAEVRGLPTALAVSPDGATVFAAIGRTVRALPMAELFAPR
ncbi:MAG: WD40 repeat domain-containing protein [Planctomycetes bacterium]|nr:WD40 repeat domain-containing protein [Planctomycetota bacterium]